MVARSRTLFAGVIALLAAGRIVLGMPASVFQSGVMACCVEAGVCHCVISDAAFARCTGQDTAHERSPIGLAATPLPSAASAAIAPSPRGLVTALAIPRVSALRAAPPSPPPRCLPAV